MAFADFTAYQENCNRCSQCKFVPMPESHEFSSICPSIDYGNFHAYSGSGKVITGYAVTRGAAPVTTDVIDSVFACTMCGGCDIACKTNLGDEVEPLESIYELRAYMAQRGHVPPALIAMMEKLRREGSHLGSRVERSRRADGLGIRDAAQEKVEVLLHVDGENAFDRAQWPQLRALVRLLQAASVDFGIAYDAESDSGALAFELGFSDDARALATHQQTLLRQSGASILLAASAGAYAAFRNFYSRLGVPLGDVRIVHSTEFIAELIASGRMQLAADGPLRATYHDPCKLGRLSEPHQPWSGRRVTVLNTLQVPDSPRPQRFGVAGQYEAPRRLLRAVKGLELVEMERNHEFGFCCGAGAGVPDVYPEMAEMAGLSRLREARKTGATHLVTACARCQRHLTATAARNGIDIEVRGVFELLADSADRVSS